jgi:hypothetical protein
MMHETCNKQQAVGKAFCVGVSSDSKQLNMPRITQPTESLPRFTRLLSAVLLSLILACTLTLLGCSDDDQETVSLADVPVSNATSVFNVLENRSFQFTASGGGIFGVNEGRMEFGAVTIDANGVPRAPFTLVDEVNVDDTTGEELSAEGESDGEASCNFLFTTSTFQIGQGPQVSQNPEDKIECETCVVSVSATSVPVSGTGPGMLEWVLAAAPNAIDNPNFTSVALNVTVGVDTEGNLVSINGEPVTPDN